MSLLSNHESAVSSNDEYNTLQGPTCRGKGISPYAVYQVIRLFQIRMGLA
jgi:hypothetical protein